MEAITDPEGTGWMDPNGSEVADKCENGPQIGTPIGYAADGSPFNQVINGDRYLLQGMWSNVLQGCMQASSSTKSALPLATVNLTQFSATVTGNIAKSAAGGSATVFLVRAGELVAGGRRGDEWPRQLALDPALAERRFASGGRRRSGPDHRPLQQRRAGAGRDRDRRRRQPVHRGGLDRLVCTRHGLCRRPQIDRQPGPTGVLIVRVDGKATAARSSNAAMPTTSRRSRPRRSGLAPR